MKACPQCGKSYGDEFLVCPEDHVALVGSPIAGPPPPAQTPATPPRPDPTDMPLSTHSIDTALAPLKEVGGPDHADPSSPESEEKPLAPGTVLGSYRLLETLGEGGMGFVYLAEHTRLGRKVALKLLRSEFAANPKATARFFSEARAVNQIAHENIIQITDFIDDQGPEKYYIMELLQGESLAKRMRKTAAVPVPQLLDIAIQVCNALAAVHDAGMVHRDLKPDNIYLIEHAGLKDFVKLLDFGVVKLGNLVEDAPRGNTAAGSILGTPEYMSPEQVSSNPVDHRTDVYALGVILYEGVTGRKPFTAKSFGEMVVNHLTVPPPKPSSLKNAPQAIPPRLEALILKCLAKDRESRPPSMVELETRLRRLREELPATAAAAPPVRSRRLPLAIAALLFLLAVAAGSAYTLHERGILAAPEPPPVAAARPASVEIVFDSQPQGAEVFVDGREDPLGMTPFAARLKRVDEPRTFRFELAGYQSASQSVPLHQNARVAVVLAEVEPSPPLLLEPQEQPKKAKRKAPTRRGTMNPFE